MSIQKGPIQVMIGLIFKEKQQLALVIKNPSHQVRHIKEIKILNRAAARFSNPGGLAVMHWA